MRAEAIVAIEVDRRVQLPEPSPEPAEACTPAPLHDEALTAVRPASPPWGAARRVTTLMTAPSAASP